MYLKCKSTPSAATTAKLSRQSISLEEKRHEKSERLKDISYVCSLAPSTIKTIILNREKIKASGESATPGSALQVTYDRDHVMENGKTFECGSKINISEMCH